MFRLLFCISTLLLSLCTLGQERLVWTGAKSYDFHEAENWNLNRVPGPQDTAYLNLVQNSDTVIINQRVQVLKLDILNGIAFISDSIIVDERCNIKEVDVRGSLNIRAFDIDLGAENRPVLISGNAGLSADKIKLAFTRIQGNLSILKKGDDNDFCQGGNEIFGNTSIRCYGRGNFSMGGNFADKFRGKLNIASYDTCAIQFAFKGLDNSFGDSIIIEEFIGDVKWGQQRGMSEFASDAPLYLKNPDKAVGNLWLKGVSYLNTSQLIIQPADTTVIQLDSCHFYAGLKIDAGSIRILHTTFEEAIELHKRGEKNDISKGGNTFKKRVSIDVYDDGFLLFANNFPDEFQGPLYAHSHKLANLFLAHKADGSVFRDSVVVSSQLGGGVKFGFANGSSRFTGSSILAIDEAGFKGGKLSFRFASFDAGEPLELNLSDSAIFHLEKGSVLNRRIRISTPNIKVDSSIVNRPLEIEKNGKTNDSWMGGGSFNDSLIISIVGKGSLFLSTQYPDQYNGPIEGRLVGKNGLYLAHSSGGNTLRSAINLQLNDSSNFYIGQNRGQGYIEDGFSLAFKNDSLFNAKILIDSLVINTPLNLLGMGEKGQFELEKCTLNFPVFIDGPRILLAENSFKQRLEIHKRAKDFDNCRGGNEFNGLHITNHGEGTMNFGQVLPDQYRDSTVLECLNEKAAIILSNKVEGNSIEGVLHLKPWLGKVGMGLAKGTTTAENISINILDHDSIKGAVDLNQLFQNDASALDLRLKGDGNLNIDSSRIVGPLYMEANNVFLEKTQCSSPVHLVKTGGNNNIGSGDNRFQSSLKIENRSAQTWGSDNNFPSVYRDSLFLINSGGGIISLSYKAEGNEINGVVSLSSDSGEVRIGSEGGTTLFTGSFLDARNSFHLSKLQLSGFHSNTSLGSSISLASDAVVNLGPNSTWQSDLEVKAGGINLNGIETFSDLHLEKTGSNIDNGRGNNQIRGNLTAISTGGGFLQLAFRDSNNVFHKNIWLHADASSGIRFGAGEGRSEIKEGYAIKNLEDSTYLGSLFMAQFNLAPNSTLDMEFGDSSLAFLGPNSTFSEEISIRAGSVGLASSTFHKSSSFENTGRVNYSSEGNCIFLDSTRFVHSGYASWGFQSNQLKAPAYFEIVRDSSNLFTGNLNVSNNLYINDLSSIRANIFIDGIYLKDTGNFKVVNLSDTLQLLRNLESNFSGLPVDFVGRFKLEKALNLVNGVVRFGNFPIRLTPNSNVSGGNDLAYIEGSVIKEGGFNFVLPLGADGYYRPVGFFKNQNDNSVVEVSYISNSFVSDFPSVDIPSDIDFLSQCGYWVVSNPDKKIVAPLLFAPRDSLCYPLAPENLSPIAFVNGSFYPLANSLRTPNTNFYITEADSALTSNFILTFGSAYNFRPFAFPMSNFILSKRGAVAELKFTTLYENNNQLYELQRSDNNGAFIAIDSLPPGPNPTQEQSYLFLDTLGNDGIYRYRIRQESIYGVSSYSTVKALNLNGTSDLFAYPSPFSENGLRLSVLNNDVGEVRVHLIDLYGKVYYTGIFQKGENPLDIDLFRGNALKEGVYYLRVASPSEERNIPIVKRY